MSLGPVVGGLLVDTIGWRGMFWVNIPVGLVAIALTARFVPESRAPRRAAGPGRAGAHHRHARLADLRDHRGTRARLAAPVIVALFAVAAVALAVFVAYEARRTEPVLDPRFFRSAPFAGSVLTAISATAAVGGFLFLATLYLQDVRGMSALRAGLHMLPMATMMALGAVGSSRILARRGARLPMMARPRRWPWAACCCPGSPLSSASSLIVAFVVFGIGGGMVNAPITHTAVSGMPFSQAAWPRGSPPPVARSARRSASRSPARSWPETAGPAADRVHVGQPRRLAAAGRLRCRRLRARPGHDDPVGAPHGHPYRGPLSTRPNLRTPAMTR